MREWLLAATSTRGQVLRAKRVLFGCGEVVLQPLSVARLRNSPSSSSNMFSMKVDLAKDFVQVKVAESSSGWTISKTSSSLPLAVSASLKLFAERGNINR